MRKRKKVKAPARRGRRVAWRQPGERTAARWRVAVPVALRTSRDIRAVAFPLPTVSVATRTEFALLAVRTQNTPLPLELTRQPALPNRLKRSTAFFPADDLAAAPLEALEAASRSTPMRTGTPRLLLTLR